jgi:photosystem II stability/assembly factor-like uncharacterized protein
MKINYQSKRGGVMLSETTCLDSSGKSRYAGKRIIIVCVFLTTLFGVACSSSTEPEEVSGKAYSLAIGSNNQVFVATNEGLCKSMDDGNTWEYVNRSPSDLASVSPLGVIYCMSYEKDGPYTTKKTLCRSTDNGKTFSVTAWVTNKTVFGMRWLAFNNQEHLFTWADAYPGKLYRSTDNGQNWEELMSDMLYNMSNLIVPNDMFATLGGVIRSVNNGDSWNTVLSSQNISGASPYSFDALAFNSQDRIFAVVNTYQPSDSVKTGMVYYSNNNGNSWVKTVVSNSDITNLAVNSQDKIFAITELHEVYCSIDNGIQWNKVNVNLPESWVQQFIISPNNKLFIRTWDGTNYEIYRSQNDGVNWEQIWPQ